jgi:hypothetical protein
VRVDASGSTSDQVTVKLTGSEALVLWDLLMESGRETAYLEPAPSRVISDLRWALEPLVVFEGGVAFEEHLRRVQANVAFRLGGDFATPEEAALRPYADLVAARVLSVEVIDEWHAIVKVHVESSGPLNRAVYRLRDGWWTFRPDESHWKDWVDLGLDEDSHDAESAERWKRKEAFETRLASFEEVGVILVSTHAQHNKKYGEADYRVLEQVQHRLRSVSADDAFHWPLRSLFAVVPNESSDDALVMRAHAVADDVMDCVARTYTIPLEQRPEVLVHYEISVGIGVAVGSMPDVLEVVTQRNDCADMQLYENVIVDSGPPSEYLMGLLVEAAGSGLFHKDRRRHRMLKEAQTDLFESERSDGLNRRGENARVALATLVRFLAAEGHIPSPTELLPNGDAVIEAFLRNSSTGPFLRFRSWRPTW